MHASRWDQLILEARLATLADDGYGLVDDGAIAWACGRIAWVGPRRELPGAPDLLAHRVESAGGALVTPGLVDCHTHLVFAGDRAHEFEMRLGGASYADIARAGGGIAATVRATRAADVETLVALALPRARDLIADGSTTIEVKSGYGLSFADERKLLEAVRALGARLGITMPATYLGAHALPPGAGTDADAYIDEVCASIPTLAAAGLVDAVDAYCEHLAFAPAQVARVFAAARAAGIPVKLHADQLSDLGGAGLAARHGALSADHLEYTDEAGVAALAAAGTVAVLLPAAFYALREIRLPPIAALRARGVPMAVATDLNPGTSPLRSQRIAMNLACTLFGLTPLEALRGATVHAAAALGLGHRKGRLVAGHDADLVVWDCAHPAALAYWIGGRLARAVYAAGRRIDEPGASPGENRPGSR